jgi:predicted HTH domain antitoxin
LFENQKEKYHLINAVMHINKVTIKDVNISLNIEQFVKSSLDLQAVSLVNMQSEYNQIELDKRSCNITGFMTVLDLLQHCTFIQEEINSVAQFCRAMIPDP